ncbi:hypothetical protein Cadr_000028849 [Camelus dromedarius]|uniref:Uncharacterized protein n=1 Tax=Camelus dromedarius TaxID=9838 RepID=A0A5N4C7S4_CAMDR|nr:hypothetical protein Cadr_000028849 [Camelus dromedarius]
MPARRKEREGRKERSQFRTRKAVYRLSHPPLHTRAVGNLRASQFYRPRVKFCLYCSPTIYFQDDSLTWLVMLVLDAGRELSWAQQLGASVSLHMGLCCLVFQRQASSERENQGSPVYRITWCRFPSHRKPLCELVALMPRVDFPQSFSPGTSRACRTWTEIHPDVRAFGDSCGAAVCTPQVHPGLGRLNLSWVTVRVLEVGWEIGAVYLYGPLGPPCDGGGPSLLPTTPPIPRFLLLISEREKSPVTISDSWESSAHRVQSNSSEEPGSRSLPRTMGTRSSVTGKGPHSCSLNPGRTAVVSHCGERGLS